jgi:hypothetical protein
VSVPERCQCEANSVIILREQVEVNDLNTQNEPVSSFYAIPGYLMQLVSYPMLAIAIIIARHLRPRSQSPHRQHQ